MINGIVNIYKEKGYTSNDVVCRLRGILHQRKIGHTGTLDPDAVGVLPVCLGSGTKLCEMLTDHDKEYRAVMRLGVTTDTQDLSGTVLSEQKVTCSTEEVEKVINTFVGGYDQVPPMYSALKVNGKKLYEYARAGVEIERKARRVNIYDIVIEKIELPEVTFRVSCSKGTYIRTLCQDIGEQCGCGAALSYLERTRVDRFTIDRAITLDDLEKARDDGTLAQYIDPVDLVFQDLPRAYPADAQALARLLNGNPLSSAQLRLPDGEQTPARIRLYDKDDAFLAVYLYDGRKKMYMPEKMFLSSK